MAAPDRLWALRPFGLLPLLAVRRVPPLAAIRAALQPAPDPIPLRYALAA
ncbi:MAG: hypothetical protein KIT22_02915 [Verrucomicrobiae bacterium]|nr:hypothetical protein [Verrucomicrobiae bacterium]